MLPNNEWYFAHLFYELYISTPHPAIFVFFYSNSVINYGSQFFGVFINKKELHACTQLRPSNLMCPLT